MIPSVFPSVIDPDLYPGVAVDLTKDELRADVRYARLWRRSDSPQNAEQRGVAWCMVWPKRKRPRPQLALFPLDALRVSQNPTEPPPMPRWACCEGLTL
jgi:hypothetical protein